MFRVVNMMFLMSVQSHCSYDGVHWSERDHCFVTNGFHTHGQITRCLSSSV